jgi:TPR repeat protein
LKADPDRAPVERPSGNRFALIVIVLIVIIALAVAGYFLKDRFFPPEAAAPAAAPAQSELEQIKTFLSANPNAPERLAKARETLAACQLNWASTLYRDLGQAGDAEAALAMGRLYDPVDPVCPAVGAPSRTVSSDTAAFWYRKAIDAKSVEAQRRLGAMLVAAGKDDPKYQEGIDLLKAAAASGDADAAAKLKELGQ